MTTIQTMPAGPAGQTQDPKAGVTEEMIRELVDAFYSRARADPTLGPIFNGVVGDRWSEHLAKMCDFWSSVMLGTRRFSGAPVQAHARVDAVRAPHFALWLSLFRQAARDVCPPAAAALFIAKAEAIAPRLQGAVESVRSAGPGLAPRAPRTAPSP